MGIHLRRELDKLRKNTLSLGAAVEENLRRALAVLQSGDEGLVDEIVEADQGIDRMEVEVEEECLKMFALYQPVAGDLRYIISVLKLTNDLERIGDLAVNIATKTRHMTGTRFNPYLEPLRTMGELASRMLKQSLDALVEMDISLAEKVRGVDDQVDNLLRDTIEQTIRTLQGGNQEAIDIGEQIAILGAARNIERIADLATNICEDVIYCVQGRIVRHPGRQVDHDAV